jgi:hypothetical protein
VGAEEGGEPEHCGSAVAVDGYSEIELLVGPRDEASSLALGPRFFIFL